MKVVVNRDNCIGCGACEAICPSVFQLDDEGLSKVICEDFSKVKEEDIVEAKESCPTSAIEEVTEEDIVKAKESCPTSATEEEEK